VKSLKRNEESESVFGGIFRLSPAFPPILWSVTMVTLVKVNSVGKVTLFPETTFLHINGTSEGVLKLLENPSLIINNKAVEQVSSAKSLGVYIDQTLN